MSGPGDEVALARNLGAAGMFAALLAVIAWPSEPNVDPVMDRLVLGVFVAAGVAVGVAASAARARLRALRQAPPEPQAPDRRGPVALLPVPLALLGLLVVSAVTAGVGRAALAGHPQGGRVAVLVAATDLGAGAVLDRESLSERTVPAALAGPGLARAEGGEALLGARTLVPLRAGEPVLRGLTSRWPAPGLCPPGAGP